MYYIYLDESDKHGAYFSNFYGGIIIPSQHHDRIIERLKSLVQELGLAEEEVKWQKVNAYTFDKYIRIVDELFDILACGNARIRIFFSPNLYRSLLPAEDKIYTYTKLYYQFIKYSFGLPYAPKGDNRVKLIFDELPIGDSQRADFIRFLCGLSEMDDFKRANIVIQREHIIEVDSRNHLPLQCLDLVLGAMCFRLNNKHKEKNPVTGKRGVRTILKEKLYNHIRKRICLLLSRNFNVGVSTGIQDLSERWSLPYSHWSFKPNDSEEDHSFAKHKKKE